jgi:hypothetical protein
MYGRYRLGDGHYYRQTSTKQEPKVKYDHQKFAMLFSPSKSVTLSTEDLLTLFKQIHGDKEMFDKPKQVYLNVIKKIFDSFHPVLSKILPKDILDIIELYEGHIPELQGLCSKEIEL